MASFWLLARSGEPFYYHFPVESASAGDALIKAIVKEVVRELERLLAMQQRLMDVHDAATYLGMTVAALRKKTGTSVPCKIIDGKLRFDRKQLDDWIDRAPTEGL